jgi:hypothetical protein
MALVLIASIHRPHLCAQVDRHVLITHRMQDEEPQLYSCAWPFSSVCYSFGLLAEALSAAGSPESEARRGAMSSNSLDLVFRLVTLANYDYCRPVNCNTMEFPFIVSAHRGRIPCARLIFLLVDL